MDDLNIKKIKNLENKIDYDFHKKLLFVLETIEELNELRSLLLNIFCDDSLDFNSLFLEYVSKISDLSCNLYECTELLEFKFLSNDKES